MAGFADIAALQAAIAAGQTMTAAFSKSGNSISTAIGSWGGNWDQVKLPVAGAAPAGTPGVAYDQTTGGILFPDLSPMTKWLSAFGARCSSNATVGTVWLFDRLVGVGGIAMNSTGDKTINSTALPRYSGDAVWPFLEITTAGTTTAPVVSMTSYTDQSGNAASVGGSVTFPSATTPAGRLVPLPLADGDWGVRSVETINVSVAGGGSGVCSLVLLRALAMVPIQDLETIERSWPLPYTAPIRIYDGATLFPVAVGPSGAENFEGYVSIVFA